MGPEGDRHGRGGAGGRGLLPRALTTRKRLLIAAGLVAAALAVALGAIFGGAAGEQVGARLQPLASPPRAPAAPAAPAPPAGFTRFSAPGRFSIAYPSDWRRLGTRGAGVDLLATTRGEAASVLVRTTALRVPIGRGDLGKVRNLTDEIVASGRQVRLLAEARQIELGGLPGYFYFYSFRDPRTDRRGTHSHYFLFRGDTMITIVLQALPERRFERFSEDFDRIAASFRAVSR